MRRSEGPRLAMVSAERAGIRSTITCLCERADSKDIPLAKQVFEALGTTEFEVVMTALKKAAVLMPVYAKTNSKLTE